MANYGCMSTAAHICSSYVGAPLRSALVMQYSGFLNISVCPFVLDETLLSLGVLFHKRRKTTLRTHSKLCSVVCQHIVENLVRNSLVIPGFPLRRIPAWWLLEIIVVGFCTSQTAWFRRFYDIPLRSSIRHLQYAARTYHFPSCRTYVSYLGVLPVSIMWHIQQTARRDIGKSSSTAPSSSATCVKNRFLSCLQVDPGNPTVEDAWQQHKSFACSFMNFCAVISRFSSLLPVSKAYTLDSLTPCLSFSGSSNYMHTILAFSFWGRLKGRWCTILECPNWRVVVSGCSQSR